MKSARDIAESLSVVLPLRSETEDMRRRNIAMVNEFLTIYFKEAQRDALRHAAELIESQAPSFQGSKDLLVRESLLMVADVIRKAAEALE